MVVAGGGAGGSITECDGSGGGGGGGVSQGSMEIEPDGSTFYELQVGAGGNETTRQGENGYDSIFGDHQVYGGGSGGACGDNNGKDGGSGGGAGYKSTQGHTTRHSFEFLLSIF